jgi:hypothetical protein
VLDVKTLARPVELVGDCTGGGCLEFAVKLHKAVQDRKYQRGASIMENPASLLDWRAMHRTARKRADRCQRLGYTVTWVDYSEFDDDIHEINTSLERRQGRPMSDGYLHWTRHSSLPEFPCEVHRTITYGILGVDQRLRAYLTLHRSGELALVSMILGHGAFLKDEVMYLLFAGAVEDQAGLGGIFYYNRHDSGGPGLKWFKERLGFQEANVDWIL